MNDNKMDGNEHVQQDSIKENMKTIGPSQHNAHVSGQAETLCTHKVPRAVPHLLTLTAMKISQGILMQKFFTGQMPFLAPNQQHQSTETTSM